MMFALYDRSPVGRLLLAAGESGLTGLWMEGQKYFPVDVGPVTAGGENCPVLTEAERWLDRYFAGERPELSRLKLSPAGSEFQRQVWSILCRIPYGEVRTYGEIAGEVAALRRVKSMSPQAVGGAIGRNPISIIIPCHRVVGADGSLTGYAGGVERKQFLLVVTTDVHI